MKIIKSLNEINKNEIALTIGNFDGVHIGHRFVIDHIKNKISKDMPFLLLTFEPHPIEVLSPRKNYLINQKKDKYDLLKDAGVDYIFEVEFTRDLSTLSGADFLERNLYRNGLCIDFYLGYDFSFGANKKDGSEIINDFCEQHGFSFHILDQKESNELSISSSSIRDEIRKCKIVNCNKLLGRAFSLHGTVVKGEGRGRQIGYPTANLQYSENQIIPGKGVYQTSVLYNGGKYKSVTNIGINPTFEKGTELTVETFILDFDRDIYGESFKLFFHKEIRDEKKFNSVNELIEQIRKDVELRKTHD